MKIIKNVAVISALLLVIPAVASAADAAPAPAPAAPAPAAPAPAAPAPAAPAAKKALNPWEDCGIGAMLFNETTWAAVISNVIWDLGTTAVTSNISSQETCSGKHAKVAQFIGVTYANLEEETIKGDGQHVHAMLNIMGCDASAHANIISAVRADFGNSVRNADYAEKTALVKAEDYYNLVQAKVSG